MRPIPSSWCCRPRVRRRSRRSRATKASTTYARWLADDHIDFREIAGNDGDVLVSLLVPDAWHPDAGARVLFEQPVLTMPGRKRSVLALPIMQLGALLRDVDRQPALQVEHVYDF